MGSGRFRKSSSFRESAPGERHRFEHWYRDRTVYFITARVRNRVPAFKSEQAKTIFWDRFLHWAKEYGFVPWIVTLMDNHYHVLGYLKEGRNLGEMMRRIHGSVAKLVNDTLKVRQRPFWRDARKRNDYFDGCIRDELQCRRAYGYTLRQCKRHGICNDPCDYPHTRIFIALEKGIKRAHELNAFMEGVGYKRYEAPTGKKTPTGAATSVAANRRNTPMPTTDPLTILLKHDHWATKQILAACSKLTPDQFHRRFEMGPGSLHDTLTHMLAAMRAWADMLHHREMRPRLEGNQLTIESLPKMFEESTADLVAAAHSLDETVSRERDGKTYTFTRVAVLTHVTTHGMHHRAQCLNMLRHVGVKPLPMSSVVEWSRSVDSPM